MIATCTKCSKLFESTEEDASTPGTLCPSCHRQKAVMPVQAALEPFTRPPCSCDWCESTAHATLASLAAPPSETEWSVRNIISEVATDERKILPAIASICGMLGALQDQCDELRAERDAAIADAKKKQKALDAYHKALIDVGTLAAVRHHAEGK